MKFKIKIYILYKNIKVYIFYKIIKNIFNLFFYKSHRTRKLTFNVCQKSMIITENQL